MTKTKISLLLLAVACACAASTATATAAKFVVEKTPIKVLGKGGPVKFTAAKTGASITCASLTSTGPREVTIKEPAFFNLSPQLEKCTAKIPLLEGEFVAGVTLNCKGENEVTPSSVTCTGVHKLTAEAEIAGMKCRLETESEGENETVTSETSGAKPKTVKIKTAGKESKIVNAKGCTGVVNNGEGFKSESAYEIMGATSSGEGVGVEVV